MGAPARACLAVSAIVAAALTVSPAHSQIACPGQTIRFVVPVGQRMQERIGLSIVVENRPGANGGVAAASLAGSPADGCTLLVTDGSILSINPHTNRKLNFRPSSPRATRGRCASRSLQSDGHSATSSSCACPPSS